MEIGTVFKLFAVKKFLPAALLMVCAPVGPAFAGPGDDEKSIKAFMQAAKVFQHPRCVNCHASGDGPTQGDDNHLHVFGVKRGPMDRGVGGYTCKSCHQAQNIAGIPGEIDWHMAPQSMSWGKGTAAEICRRIADKTKNGNREPKGVALHIENDALVIWAWQPGDNRSSPFMPHDAFMRTLQTWAKNGAKCPE